MRICSKYFGQFITQQLRTDKDLTMSFQYRSVIFYHTPEQELSARRSIEELEKSGRFSNRIVTEIVPATTFYKAEEYHQKYYEKKGGGSCYF